MSVINLRRPGQCCGLCMHVRPTGDERRWYAFVCSAITATDGKPGSLPVVPEAGTHCRYFRQAPAGTEALSSAHVPCLPPFALTTWADTSPSVPNDSPLGRGCQAPAAACAHRCNQGCEQAAADARELGRLNGGGR